MARTILGCLQRALKSRALGQSLVEFALTLPIFLYITIGVVDLGRGVIANTIVSNAAREGARAGIYANTDNATISTAINQETAFIGSIPVWTSGPQPENRVVITPALQSARTSGTSIQVAVYYTFHPITPLLGRLVGNSINMTASSTMTIE